MARLSQKQILSEGFGDLLKKGKDAAGNMWKKTSKARGIAAGIGEVIAPEMKTEVDRWKGWAKGVKKGKDRFQSPEDRLDKFLEDEGYVRVGDPRGAGEIKSIDVGRLDFDATGAPLNPGDHEFVKHKTPLIVKFTENEWKIIQRPRGDWRTRPSGGGPPQPHTAPNPPGPTGPSP